MKKTVVALFILSASMGALWGQEPRPATPKAFPVLLDRKATTVPVLLTQQQIDRIKMVTKTFKAQRAELTKQIKQLKEQEALAVAEIINRK